MPVKNVNASLTLHDRVDALEAMAYGSGALLGASKVYAGNYVPASQTAGTDTAAAVGTIFVSELALRDAATITGISFLIGSVGGTDKVIVSLYEADGTLIANSAVAGVTVGTLATFQRVPLLSQITLTPGRYYVGVQFNGTTAKLRTQSGGDNNSGTVTGQTFGTPLSIAPPASFTVNTAPIAMTY